MRACIQATSLRARQSAEGRAEDSETLRRTDWHGGTVALSVYYSSGQWQCTPQFDECECERPTCNELYSLLATRLNGRANTSSLAHVRTWRVVSITGERGRPGTR
eukprot:scaffold6931_cov119-Isochrysis_galbana.AAC.12